MFLSKTKKQSRFEKFISTLIVTVMSLSFLLSGLPSQGEVRSNSGNLGIEKAEAAVSTGAYVFVTKWGSDGDGNGQFHYPNGVAVDSSSNVYVSESSWPNYRIQKFNSIGGYITQWSSSGLEPGGVAVDSSDNVYVVNWWHNIWKFDSNGSYITKWGSYGTGDGQFKYPRGVAVDSSGSVYVADSGNDRIQKFTSDGTYITQWGSSGAGNGQFGYIKGVAVDSSGNVYVSESDSADSHRIQKFNSSGGYITQWSAYGLDPSSVAVDSSGNVYVADWDNHRIQKFDSNGSYITKWGSYGTGDGQFFYPDGVTVDSSGNVYVSDSYNDRIQKFAPVPDTTPPTLVYSQPPSGAINVPVSIRAVTLGFSKPIFPADATAIGTKLRFKKQSDGSYHDTRFINFSNVSGNDYKIDLFNADLASDTTYIVEISGFQDAAGNPIAYTKIPFTTGSGTPPPPDNQGPSAVMIDFSQIKSEVVENGETLTRVEVPDLISTTSANVQISIPTQAVITTLASHNWDGMFNLPKEEPVTSTQMNNPKAVNIFAVEIGADDIPLYSNKAIKVVFPNQKGKKVGYLRGGIFTQITRQLIEDSQTHADNNIPEKSDGYINVDTDLVVWTKHFTKFVTYDEDLSAPTTTKVLSRKANSRGWHKTNITILLSARDKGGSGLDKIYYRIRATGTLYSTTSASIKIPIKTEGIKTIYYYSKDLAGNKGSTKSVTVRIDKTRPKVSYYPSPSTIKRGKYVKLYYKMYDNLSPKVYVRIKLINPKGKVVLNKALGAKIRRKAYSYSYRVPSTAVFGTYKYIVILKDYARNIRTTSAKTFKVVKPVIIKPIPPKPYPTGVYWNGTKWVCSAPWHGSSCPHANLH